jgi:acetyl esterase
MPSTTPRSDIPSSRERLEGRLARVLGHLPGAWLLRTIGESPMVRDGQSIDPHVQFILAARKHKPQPLMCGPTPVEARLRSRREISAIATHAGVRPTRVREVRSIAIDGADGPLNARLYAPLTGSSNVPQSLLVYFHGGGFVICDLDTHDEACRILCQTGNMHVLSVAYRLAPEHPFPAPLDDCCAAARWALKHAASLGADPTRVAVGGDSAGGNLATVAALTLARESTPVAAQLLIYPLTDVLADFPSRRTFGSGFLLTAADISALTELYLGTDEALRKDPRVSPARAADLALSPPALVVTAGFDPLRDEGEAYADLLRHAGVIAHVQRVAGHAHGFLHLTTIVPTARAATMAIATAFRALLSEAATAKS